MQARSDQRNAEALVPAEPSEEPDLESSPNAETDLTNTAVDGFAELATCPALDALDANSPPRPTLHEQMKQHLGRLQELSTLAAAHDQNAVTEIQAIFENNQELFNYLGDIELQTELMLLECLPSPACTKSAYGAKLQELKKSLTSDNPTPLEKMAVGRVAACWLYAQFCDRWCGYHMKQNGAVVRSSEHPRG